MWTISRCLGALWRAGCMLVIPRCCCSPVHWALSSGLWSPFILGTVITLSRELFIAHHVPVIAACHVIVNTGIPVNTPHEQLPVSRLIFLLHVFCTQSTAHSTLQPTYYNKYFTDHQYWNKLPWPWYRCYSFIYIKVDCCWLMNSSWTCILRSYKLISILPPPVWNLSSV